MAYELHIDKGPRNLSLGEWKLAVESTEGARFVSRDHTIINPTTGERITIPYRDGDVEVYWPTDEKWRAAFSWFEGVASFRANFSPGDRSNPVWRAAVQLASKLGAVIRGDNGEIYDHTTGDVVDV